MRFSVIIIALILCCEAFAGRRDTSALKREYWIMRFQSVSFPLKKIQITSTFGTRRDPFTKEKAYHSGLDLQANYENVYSMFDGIVETIGSNSRSGNFIVMRYGEYTVGYCHLSRRFVNEGDSVYAGDAIAVSGCTGRATGPHLHLSCKKGGKVRDPHDLLLYIKQVREECLAALGVAARPAEPISCTDFISRYATLAMDHQRRYGIPASVTLAQMALESDWGNSDLAVKGNNFFGIKATRKWIADGKPYSLHNDEKKNEKFCNYDAVEESMEHHSRLLTSNHYKKYCSYPPTDYHRWLKGLIRAGYASANNYVASCEKIIKQYKLYRYDEQANRL